MEYILNAAATVIDKHTVEVAGERFTPRTSCWPPAPAPTSRTSPAWT